MHSYVLWGTAALVVYYVVTSALAWYKLRKFKGPFLARFSYAWLAKTAFSGRAFQIHIANFEKYGEPLLRIAPNMLVTGDPDVFRHISGTRSRYVRSPQYYKGLRINPYLDNLLSTTNTRLHDDIKARIAGGYGGRDVPTLEADIDEQVQALTSLLRRKYADQKLVDFAETAQYFTLDAITKLAYGKEFGFLSTDSDVYDYIKVVEGFTPTIALACDIPWVMSIVFSPLMLKLLGPKSSDPSGVGKLMGVAEEVVGKRFEPGAKDQKDMLGAFVRGGLSQQQCEAEVALQIIAGSDTTANGIRTTMLYLMSNPKAYYRLQKEIDNGINAGKISSPISLAEAKALPYLQAVVYEGLRIIPPSQLLLSKEVPPEGDTINGKFLPPGTLVSVNTHSIARHKPTFGDDVHVFRPERFMEADKEKRLEMEKVVELVFGYGRWQCVGKPVAFIELNKVFVELLREFDFQLVDPAAPWKLKHWLIFFVHDMWVRVTSRGSV